MAIGLYQRRPETVRAVDVGFIMRMNREALPYWVQDKIFIGELRVFEDGVEANTPHGWCFGTPNDVLVCDMRGDMYVEYGAEFAETFQEVED